MPNTNYTDFYSPLKLANYNQFAIGKVPWELHLMLLVVVVMLHVPRANTLVVDTAVKYSCTTH